MESEWTNPRRDTGVRLQLCFPFSEDPKQGPKAPACWDFLGFRGLSSQETPPHGSQLEARPQLPAGPSPARPRVKRPSAAGRVRDRWIHGSGIPTTRHPPPPPQRGPSCLGGAPDRFFSHYLCKQPPPVPLPSLYRSWRRIPRTPMRRKPLPSCPPRPLQPPWSSVCCLSVLRVMAISQPSARAWDLP